MNLARLFSPCLFTHSLDRVMVLHGKALHMECARCQMDLGPVLAGQRYRERKEKKVRTKRSAAVLRMAKRQAS